MFSSRPIAHTIAAGAALAFVLGTANLASAAPGPTTCQLPVFGPGSS